MEIGGYENPQVLIFDPLHYEIQHIKTLVSFNGEMPTRQLLRDRVEVLVSIAALEFGLEVNDGRGVVVDANGKETPRGVRAEYAVIIGGPRYSDFILSTLEFLLIDKLGVRVAYPVLSYKIEDGKVSGLGLVNLFEPAVHLILDADEGGHVED